MTERYEPREIERKWQERWETSGLYHTAMQEGEKFYSLTMLPYTSGDLHVGHWYAMAPADTAARYRRRRGRNVFFPIGFDAFGLPAENAAIKRGIHPHKWTYDNIDRMRGQLKRMGAMFDWSHEVITSDPEFYRWNQWFFLRFYEMGLVYRTLAPANWCPSCQTVLANEQVLPNGACERCGTEVTRRDLPQWFLRITNYADELLDHSQIDWPRRVSAMQSNWIGRSEGAEIAFGLDAPALEQPDIDQKEVRVFTTRPDTLYGVTFMVLAPEHPLVPTLTTPAQREQVEAYIEQARRQTEIERMFTEREKTGVFTGSYCLHPLTGEKVPVWIADYALVSYGTGAVMGVPAHDQRDFEFAGKFGLAVRVVIAPPGWDGEPLAQAHEETGAMVNSGPFDGIPSEQGKASVVRELESRGLGRATVNYRLRDWLISRQRYWGTPIPMVHCERCGVVPVPESDLPVLLPEDAEFKPTGESPLARHPGFVNTACPSCAGPARRETDTMDTFMDSNWYFIRYLSPHYTEGPVEPELARSWLPVDQYTGGAEHAVMHLLYARFFWKAARDLGVVQGNEPFSRLFNQGQILGPDGQRMSKSRGNVVAPDEQVERYGADCFRCYLMFLGPWDEGGPYNPKGITGIWNWLRRVWNLALEAPQFASVDAGTARELRGVTHRTLRKVSDDLEQFRFNTMIAAMMEMTNFLVKSREAGPVDRAAWDEAVSALVLMMAPAAPHLAEEVWERLGGSYSVHQQPWPQWDGELAREEEVTLVLQVNGKVRDRLAVGADIGEEQAKEMALASERVQAHVDGKQIMKVIYVPGKLVNIVVR